MAPTAPKRWSADGWMFLRDGGPGIAGAGSRAAPYGASQAGAILRYRLRPSSGFDPQLYGRAVAALIDGGEVEGAIGLAAKPFANLPIRAHAEARVTQQAGRAEIRPAAFVTGGLNRAALPVGLELRGYAQAGYIGGDFATAFADGQVTVSREVMQFDLGRITAGAGAWGGAQKGVARMDIGPSVAVELRIGEVPARLSLDYRVRVAGDASPPSGAALTLSSGF